MLDFTDHVWVEVFISSLNRFVHADPCERALDTPLMYEGGWNKKLTHVLSFSRYGVIDASSRYTRKLVEVVTRRNSEIVPECFIDDLLATEDLKLENKFVNDYLSNNVYLNQNNDFVSSSSSLLEALQLGKIGFEALTNFGKSPNGRPADAGMGVCRTLQHKGNGAIDHALHLRVVGVG